MQCMYISVFVSPEYQTIMILWRGMKLHFSVWPVWGIGGDKVLFSVRCYICPSLRRIKAAVKSMKWTAKFTQAQYKRCFREIHNALQISSAYVWSSLTMCNLSTNSSNPGHCKDYLRRAGKPLNHHVTKQNGAPSHYITAVPTLFMVHLTASSTTS